MIRSLFAIPCLGALLLSLGCGDGAIEPCTSSSTFELIQTQIFEGRGCTSPTCHGAPASSAAAGLDLRAGFSHSSLVNVEGRSGAYMLVSPNEQETSLLYQKVAAKTLGTGLPNDISGAAMPSSDDRLSETDLALLRLWIRAGAPRTGLVSGTQELLSCELQTDPVPNKVDPLKAPAPDEGVQFYSGAWDLPAESENELCFVTYYDYSAQVPMELQRPCSDAFGGPSRQCFFYNRLYHLQDAQSHHGLVDAYIPPADKAEQWDPLGADWKNWECLGGSRSGSACMPGGDECGERSQCTTRPQNTIGCILYRNGPPELGTIAGFFGNAEVRQPLSTAQEATFRETFVPGVYAELPVKGFLVWDSHAFNPTRFDSSLEQWMNVEFAAPEERLYPRQTLFVTQDIFGMGTIEPFSSKEVCATYTMPLHSRLLTLSSHTHRFGKEFRIWYPPNEPCNSVADCGPLRRAPDYSSRTYSDPLYQRFAADALLRFDGEDEAERTFHYCARYDNGETDPMQVRRDSSKPDAETCGLVDFALDLLPDDFGFRPSACGCIDRPKTQDVDEDERHCLGGDKQGSFCGGDDSLCTGGGVCDACPLRGGVTTEEEMFVLFGSYFIEQ